jgi:hypothetical protein
MELRNNGADAEQGPIALIQTFCEEMACQATALELRLGRARERKRGKSRRKARGFTAG